MLSVENIMNKFLYRTYPLVAATYCALRQIHHVNHGRVQVRCGPSPTDAKFVPYDQRPLPHYEPMMLTTKALVVAMGTVLGVGGWWTVYLYHDLLRAEICLRKKDPELYGFSYNKRDPVEFIIT
jgi:hypothetical protein